MNIGLLGIAFVVLLALIWIKNSLYVIKEWERGVVLRLGKLLPQAKTGGVNFQFQHLASDFTDGAVRCKKKRGIARVVELSRCRS